MNSLRNKSILTLTFLFTAFLSPALSLHAEDKSEKSIQESDESVNYITHLATGVAAHLSLPISAIGGSLVGDIALYNQVPTWMHRNFNLQPPLAEGMHSTNFELIFFVIGTPVLLSMLASLGIIYKTPQWTDTYILKKNTIRTSKRNIINFLNRILIPCPFGILSGEYLSHKYGK